MDYANTHAAAGSSVARWLSSTLALSHSLSLSSPQRTGELILASSRWLGAFLSSELVGVAKLTQVRVVVVKFSTLTGRQTVYYYCHLLLTKLSSALLCASAKRVLQIGIQKRLPLTLREREPIATLRTHFLSGSLHRAEPNDAKTMQLKLNSQSRLRSSPSHRVQPDAR